MSSVVETAFAANQPKALVGLQLGMITVELPFDASQ